MDWRSSAGEFRYQHSPLIETLFEIGFAPGPSWNQKFVDQMEEAFSRDYPTKHVLSNTIFQPYVREAQSGVQMQLFDRIQFVSPSGNEMVQISPDTLTVNLPGAYPGWANFKPMILETVRTYTEIAGELTPLRVHLRYINKIGLETNSTDLEEWFVFRLTSPDSAGIGPAVGIHVQGLYAPQPAKMVRVELRSVDESLDMITFLLDLECFTSGDLSLDLKDLDSWLEDGHRLIESAWLGSVTEQLHVKYGPEAI